MLESLEQSNIKKMSVETPEKEPELLFDPEKDMNEVDKENALGIYKGIFTEQPRHAISYTVALKKILPEFKPERSDFDRWIEDNGTLHSQALTHDFIAGKHDFYKAQSDLKELFPDIYIDPELLKELLKEIERVKNGRDVYYYFSLIELANKLGMHVDYDQSAVPDFEGCINKITKIEDFVKYLALAKRLNLPIEIKLSEEKKADIKGAVYNQGFDNISYIADVLDIQRKPGKLDNEDKGSIPEQKQF